MRQVRHCGSRVQTKVRPTTGEHRRWLWAARIRGTSLNRMMVESVNQKVEEILEGRPEMMPFDLRLDLDDEAFY